MMRYLGVLVFSTLFAFAADQASGTWKIEGDVSGTAVNTTCKLRQEGTKLTGSCGSATEAGAPITGDVDGQKVTFKHGGDYEGTALTVTYSGTIGADGTMKGSINVEPFGAMGDFTAKKSE